MKTFTYTWWQMGIFKLSVLAVGAAFGAYWHEFFGANIYGLIGIAVISGGYILYVSCPCKK